MTTAETLQVEIPSRVIDPNDAPDFELMRRAIYRRHAPDAERQRELTELADLISLKPAKKEEEPVSLHDAVLQILDHLRPSPEITRGIGYRLTLDREGNISAIEKVSHLPEDRRATERAHQMVKRIASGPKKNGTSFRTNLGNLPPTRIHL